MINPDFDDYTDFNNDAAELLERLSPLDGGTTMINTGSLALVEVHGLPDNAVKSFTYRATFPVQPGQQVQVPAPEWSVRVTGRDQLPGFVLGSSDMSAVNGDLRDILVSAYETQETDHQDAARALVDEWRAYATDLRVTASHYDGLAGQLEDRLDGELGF